LENASIASVLTNPSGTSEQVHGVPNHNPNVSSSESLARKQLMAELREASTLMAESQTPEAAEFWKNHVVSLQSRLRSLHADDGNLSVGGGNQEHHQQRQHFSQPTNYSPPKYNSNAFFVPPLAQRSMDEEPSLEPDHASKQYQQQRQHPPTQYSPQRSPTHQQYRGVMSSVPPTPQLQAASQHSSGMVDVVSPADLPGGYHFEAEIDGRRFLATVPHGGVGKGETFLCDMRPLEIQQGHGGSGKPSVPQGRWRDRLCDWTAHGAMHIVNVNAVCCPLLALGQVMTRMQLDVFGRPLKVQHDSWRTMRTITLFWVAMNALIYAFFHMKWNKHMPLTVADYVAVTLLNVSMVLYTWYAVAATRSHVRSKYNIREHRFYDLEDNCCATFCLPCTICQLHRHTAPYDALEAQCCTKTGLRDTASLEFLKLSGQ
jgi:Cys-rich protein (TIGR01571 family)